MSIHDSECQKDTDHKGKCISTPDERAENIVLSSRQGYASALKFKEVVAAEINDAVEEAYAAWEKHREEYRAEAYKEGYARGLLDAAKIADRHADHRFEAKCVLWIAEDIRARAKSL